MRNVCAGVLFLCLAPSALFAQGGAAGLSIGNYQLISEQRLTRSQWYFTYKADLVNTGAARSAIVASLSSAAPNIQVVAGQGTLHFAQAPANGRATSTDTFTILVDQSAPFDLASLKWTFVNPVANPGPDQTAATGATVTLNGSGSSNPSGVGTLSFAWAFASKPLGSAATLSNSNAVSSSFVVDVPGTYVVNLTVDNGTAQDTRSVKISTANSKPTANAGPNQTVAPGATVQLDGTKSSDVDGDALSYVWTYVSVPPGSNALSAGIGSFRSAKAFFVADTAGTFILQLVVSDGKLDSASTVTITAGTGNANTPPVANAGPNQAGVNVGATVQLNGAGSTDVNGDPLTYKWTLITVPSGSTAQLSNPGAVNPSFVADRAGTYVAQLVVNDGKVDSAALTVTITVAQAPVNGPTANAGPNQTVVHGSMVTLNGSGTDPQNLPLTYAWSFVARPAGSNAVLSNTTIANPTFVADRTGDFVLQLVVNNGTLSSQPDTVTISTTNTPPVANAGANRSVAIGSMVSLDGGGSADANNDPLTYSWSFNSRPNGSNAALSAANSKTPTFVADVAGVYVAQLIVHDGFVASAPSTVTITASGIADIVVPASLAIAPGQLVPYIVKLAQPAASELTINLQSSNMGIAALASSTVTIRQGQTEPLRQVLLTGVANGTATITASAPGRAPVSTSVSVQQGTITLSISNANIYLWTAHTLTVGISRPAPAGGTAVTLVFDKKYLEITPNVVVIPQGATQATAQVRGVQVGSPAIGATAATFAPASPITVAVGASIQWSLPSVNFRVGAEDPFALLTLFATVPGSTRFDPADAIVVQVTSSNPSVAAPQHATYLFLWDGSTAPSTKVFFNAFAPGTTIIKAKGTNIPEVSMTVTVTN